jgi:hypothetical protein
MTGQPNNYYEAVRFPMARQTLILRNGKWIDKRKAPPLHRSNDAPMIIGDLPEYRAAAADKHTGKRPLIGGRRQHREFLQRNGYREVGNDYVPPQPEHSTRQERISDIRRAMGD